MNILENMTKKKEELTPYINSKEILEDLIKENLEAKKLRINGNRKVNRSQHIIDSKVAPSWTEKLQD